MDKPKITFAETVDIETYDDIARKFLKDIFESDYDACFVSDESSLSDFAGCGMPLDENDHSTLQEYHEAGKVYTVNKVLEVYGIVVEPHDLLIDVFERIRRNEKVTLN